MIASFFMGVWGWLSKTTNDLDDAIDNAGHWADAHIEQPAQRVDRVFHRASEVVITGYFAAKAGTALVLSGVAVTPMVAGYAVLAPLSWIKSNGPQMVHEVAMPVIAMTIASPVILTCALGEAGGRGIIYGAEKTKQVLNRYRAQHPDIERYWMPVTLASVALISPSSVVSSIVAAGSIAIYGRDKTTSGVILTDMAGWCVGFVPFGPSLRGALAAETLFRKLAWPVIKPTISTKIENIPHAGPYLQEMMQGLGYGVDLAVYTARQRLATKMASSRYLQLIPSPKAEPPALPAALAHILPAPAAAPQPAPAIVAAAPGAQPSVLIPPSQQAAPAAASQPAPAVAAAAPGAQPNVLIPPSQQAAPAQSQQPPAIAAPQSFAEIRELIPQLFPRTNAVIVDHATTARSFYHQATETYKTFQDIFPSAKTFVINKVAMAFLEASAGILLATALGSAVNCTALLCAWRVGQISTFIFTISQVAFQPLLWLSVLGVAFKAKGAECINRLLPLPANADFNEWLEAKQSYLKATVTQYCPQLIEHMPMMIKVIPNLFLAAVFLPAVGYGTMLYAWHVGEVSILVLGVTQVFFQSVLTFSFVARQLSKAALENIEAVLTAEDSEDDEPVPPLIFPAPSSAPPVAASGSEDDGNVGAIRSLFDDGE